MYWKEVSNAQQKHEIVRNSLQQYEEVLQKQSKNRKPEYEVASYNLYLKVVQTFHQSVSGADWHILEELEAPLEPKNARQYEFEQRREIENFKPSLLKKVFKKRDPRMDQLKDKLPHAIEADARQFMKAYGVYTSDKEIYAELVHCMQGIQIHDIKAYHYWLEKSQPFEELKKYQIEVELIEKENELELAIHHEHKCIVPIIKKRLLNDCVVAEQMEERERKSILKSVISSVSVRCAREIFDALPITKIKVKSYVPYVEDYVLAVVYKKELLNHLDFDCENSKEIIELFHHLSQMEKL